MGMSITNAACRIAVSAGASHHVPMRKHEHQGPPPSIGHLRSQGVVGFRVTCDYGDCRHSAIVAFDATCLPDATPFPSIRIERRFVCTVCGAHNVNIMPDWPLLRMANTETPGVPRIGSL